MAGHEHPPGPDHPQWKGDAAGIRAKHMWVNSHYPRSEICEHCGESKKTAYATKVQGVYTRNREDYLELCRKCHATFDGVNLEGMKGKTHSPEARAKMSVAKTGRTSSPEHCAKISAALKGRKKPPRSPEHCARLSAAAKARVRKPHSPEAKAKMSAAARARELRKIT